MQLRNGRKNSVNYGSCLLALLLVTSAQAARTTAASIPPVNNWHHLELEEMSSDGGTISYQTVYQDHPDRNESHIADLRSGRKITIRFGTGGQFSRSGRWYAYKVSAGGIGLIDTVSNEVTYETCATKFTFSLASDQVVFINTHNPKQRDCRDQLVTTDLLSSRRKVIDDVKEYALNTSSNRLAFIVESASYYTLLIEKIGTDDRATTLARSAEGLSEIAWSENGTSLAFLEKVVAKEPSEAGFIINLYANLNSQPTVSKFDYRRSSDFPAGMRVGVGRRTLRVSQDGTSVFFGMLPSHDGPRDRSLAGAAPKSTLPQIWHYLDSKTVSDWTRYAQTDGRLGVWNSGTDKFAYLTPHGRKVVTLTGDEQRMITFSDSSQDSKNVFNSIRDVFVTDLKSGESQLIIGQQDSDYLELMLPSPDGRYIGYFKDNHWWVYDLNQRTHANLTSSLGSRVHHDVRFDRSAPPRPYGSPGWTADSSSMLVYDEFDIWLVSPSGALPVKLSNGVTENKVYRLACKSEMPLLPGGIPGRGFSSKIRSFDLSSRLLLSSYGELTKRSGFSIYTPENGVKDVVYGDFYVSNILTGSDKSRLVYKREKFNAPPELVVVDGSGRKTSVLLKSNSQFRRSRWGESKLVDYVDKRGNKLQGVLLYPAHYRVGKKYPMVVSVYETQSRELHKFIIPTESDYLPVTSLTNGGYFVLLPDIAYSSAGPGVSAADSVTSAVEAVLAMGIVRRDSVGLTGASFGGYETAFIISQTSLFATAVAGSAPTDLISHYLSIERGTGEPKMWRFERDQYRLRKPLLEDYARYLKNSAVHNASDITTPLLTWIGGKDQTVDPDQGFEMYNIMRRAGKKHVLLFYPEEGHVLGRKEAMIDLNSRIREWFDHFLKGAQPAGWIVHGEGEQFQMH